MLKPRNWWRGDCIQVPVPPRGYWAKLRAGQDVTREPLPPFEGPAPKHRIVDAPLKRRLGTGVMAPAHEHPDDERDRIVAVCDTVIVAEQLTDPHPLIAQDQAAREAWALWEQESKKPSAKHDAFSSLSAPYQMNKQRLDITVADDDVPRAYRMLSTIFHAVERMGGTVRLDPKKQHIKVILLGEPMRIRLKSQAEGFTLVIDEYHAPRKNWRDTTRKHLEDEIGAFLLGLYECAAHLRVMREEQKLEDARQHEAQRQQYLRAQQQHEELVRFQGFEQVAMDWQRARMLEGFVAALERRLCRKLIRGNANPSRAISPGRNERSPGSIPSLPPRMPYWIYDNMPCPMAKKSFSSQRRGVRGSGMPTTMRMMRRTLMNMRSGNGIWITEV